MNSCDLRNANLSSSDLSDAFLSGSVFGEANTMAVDFRGTVLENARELTSQQLMNASTSYQTILPNGTKGPFVLGIGAEYPKRR